MDSSNDLNESQVEQKNRSKEEIVFKKNAKQIYSLNPYKYIDYSYLLEFNLLRLMGIEMSSVHENYQTNRGGYWRDRITNGINFPPLPIDGSHNSENGFSSPLQCKNHQTENIAIDGSSEDSFHSSVSENGKVNKKLTGPKDNKGNRVNNSVYYYHNNRYHHEFPFYHHPSHNTQGYGKRKHNSGHRSPLEYALQSIYRNRGQYHNNNHCRTSHSYTDLSSNHGSNRQYGRRMFITKNQNFSSNVLPDKFLAKAHLMQVTKVPSELNAAGEWGKLSNHIYNRFLTNQQTAETLKKKITLWRYLFIFIRNNFPKYGLFLVGSTMSGFGSNDSDVDMCLLVRHTEMDQKNEAVSHLGQISKYLKNCDFVDQVELIQAKVPILKFRSLGFEVDLNCNNAVGIRNTHLLYCYSQLDWRVRPLVLIVKLWAAKQNINDAKNMTISSYSLALMVIHYLQCGVSPPVLPCLHDVYKEKFNPLSDINQIDLHEELKPYNSQNEQSLGELLVGFLLYYANFDYSVYAISVRLGSKVNIEECRRAKSLKNEPHQWKYLCIEEPFDLTNTARAVYNAIRFQRIKKVFYESHKYLEKTRCLDSIFDLEF
ncbi:polyA polymerase CID, putative [Pediculus humanus corporis]|uniref:PolyA polymerase CID, putative n=1 Tax=Pediculus humanus subsp. corporis TaxID=121224 RepID=E0VRI1_PEDHC|nr:polyA polymerase CID, putative [Pediculus humanus corporis]EEB15987.1 polyA polymerase CID, putative [Pediculus humanus corporis]